MQLFSGREKQQMSELIDSMIAYSMTYHQERNVEGQYNYVLDPYVLRMSLAYRIYSN